MRKEFVANVSHELRTPLTVINGYLETLNESKTMDELRWRRAISQMLNQSHRMEALIKDLMVLSRLESVSVTNNHVAVDIKPMLVSIKEETLAVFRANLTINIDCDESIRLLGNPDELRSAFTNLIINAAKYTQQDGLISIRWYSDERHAYLEVEDDGEGIDAYHLPRITERFYRVDKSRSVETGGTGLGLAIVKHILLRHQAELKISSEPDNGSTFCCVFPANRAVKVAGLAAV
jgi:two-component system phosphate regulon sensor histidine kinase PhoR